MKKALSILIGLFALALSYAASLTPASAQLPYLQWQCVPPSASRPAGGFCPVNSTYPLPTSASSGGTVTITGALPSGSNTIGNVNVNGPLPTGTNNIGNVGSVSQYPNGAVPISGTSTTAASANTVTLANFAGKTTYICEFDITGGGATAATFSTVLVNNVGAGFLAYYEAIPAGVTIGLTPLQVRFSPCLPANAVNTAITVTAGSPGAGNTNFAVSATGYQL